MTVSTELQRVVLTVDRDGNARLAGCPLFRGTLEDAVDHLAGLVPVDRVTTVITPNVDQTLLLERDAALKQAFVEADLLLADGAPVVVLGRLLGARGLHRVTGADLLPATVARAARSGWRVVVTGGRHDVTDRAARRLSSRYGADVVAVPFPLLDGVDDQAGADVVDRLHELAPQIVFVCLGSPKQDVWVHHWRDRLPAAVYVGAGAAVDFAAGVRSRAPQALQRIGAEWVYRLAQEPRRLAGRYLVRGPRFLPVAARSAVAHLRRGA